jgi:hypothetical protein
VPRRPRPRRRASAATDDRPAGLRAARAPLAATLAGVALVACLVLGAGCGAGAAAGPQHYRDATFGVSITVDRRLPQWRTSTTGGAFEVSFVDPAGAVTQGRHLDALTLSLVDTGALPTGATALAAALRSLGTAMVAKLGTQAQAGTTTDVALNGLSGVVVPYAATVAGRQVVGWLYLLASSGRTYAISAQATADRWSFYRPLFTRAIGSFRVG